MTVSYPNVSRVLSINKRTRKSNPAHKKTSQRCRIIMPSIFTVVSWLPVPLVLQVAGPRATTVNIELSILELIFPFHIVRPANRDWACQTERCHTLSNKTSLQ